MTPWTRAFFAAVALTTAPTLSALSPIYSVQTGLGGIDIWDETDSFYYLTGAVQLSEGLGNHSLIDLQGEISTWDYTDEDNLDSEEIFLQATYSYTPSAGFRVPTYSLALRYLEEFGAEDEFDASTVTLILGIAYRFDDRTTLRGGLKAGDRDSDSEIDSDIAGYFVSLDLSYSESLLFYTTVGLNEGAENIRSYCSGAYYEGDPGGRWNGGRWDSNAEWSGDCENTYLTLGANYVINANHSFDVSASYQDYDTPAGSFDGQIYAIDYFFRF